MSFVKKKCVCLLYINIYKYCKNFLNEYVCVRAEREREREKKRKKKECVEKPGFYCNLKLKNKFLIFFYKSKFQ